MHTEEGGAKGQGQAAASEVVEEGAYEGQFRGRILKGAYY
jgi:hypothetical protein